MTRLDPEFLAKLVCPRTHEPLREASADELARLNAAISAGGVVNRAGTKIREPLQGALVPQREPCVYPLVDGIPVLLVDEAIPFPDVASEGRP